jgi:hypothetical protein
MLLALALAFFALNKPVLVRAREENGKMGRSLKPFRAIQ